METWILCVLLVISITILVILVYKYNPELKAWTYTKNYSPESKVWDKLDPPVPTFEAPKRSKIFVSIASYRDPELENTVRSVIETADNPGDITCGICVQNDPGDPESWGIRPDFPYIERCRIIRIPASEARGPTWARYLVSQLWDSEEFYMQIDSHTRFELHWDSDCKRMILDLGDSAVLSTYPCDFGKASPDQIPVISEFKPSGSYIGSFEAKLEQRGKVYPINLALSGGFIFAVAKLICDVPFDPYLPFLFQGEEILYSARAYEKGYRFYAPNKVVCTHQYGRADKPKFWLDFKNFDAVQKLTHEKLRYIFGVGPKPAIPDYTLERIPADPREYLSILQFKKKF